jgi:hypothetical protein
MKKCVLTALAAGLCCVATTFGQVPSYVPTSGLVGWWPFNGNANDESGNGNNGAVNGANYCNDFSGNLNSALTQSVDGSYVRTQNVLPNVSNNFTISFWANPSQSDIIKTQGITGTEGNALMSVIHPPHGSNWGSASNNAGVGINVGNNQIQIVEHTHLYVGSPLVFSGQIDGWHHIVLIYNQHIPYLYLDGLMVATGLQSNIEFVHPGSGFCSTYPESGFGNSFTPNGSPIGNYKGDFDEIGIWDRPLTVCEIQNIYNAQIGTSSTSNGISCSSYFWNGTTYTQSGQYTFLTTNAHGCDSTATLNLTINQHTSATQTQSAIDNYTWPVNGQTYSQSGSYNAVIPNSVGCDSTITLNLTMNYTGLSDLKTNAIKLYPNPAKDFVTIELTNELIGKQYLIFNELGQVMQTGRITSNKVIIPIDKMVTGSYSLHIERCETIYFNVITD